MAKLIIVDESTIVCAIFKELLEECECFDYKIVQNYEEAKKLLQRSRYEYAVVSRDLPDAKNGEVIALLNKHNIAPIVYTTKLDEDFIETFESAQIVEYILRHKFDNIKTVIERLKQLQENKKIKILILHDSSIYRSFLKNSLILHNFNVLTVENAHDAIHKIELHSDIELIILDNDLTQTLGMDALEFIRYVRKLNKPNLRILTISSETNSYKTSCFLNEGADDYMMSDHSKDELYVRIYQNIRKFS